ncbi:class I SAM-dependent methyltransferase [Cytobacillus firmus]
MACSLGKVLEIGCGPGRNSIFLAGNGAQVDAIDFSEKAIDIRPVVNRVRTWFTFGHRKGKSHSQSPNPGHLRTQKGEIAFAESKPRSSSDTELRKHTRRGRTRHIFNPKQATYIIKNQCPPRDTGFQSITSLFSSSHLQQIQHLFQQ